MEIIHLFVYISTIYYTINTNIDDLTLFISGLFFLSAIMSNSSITTFCKKIYNNVNKAIFRHNMHISKLNLQAEAINTIKVYIESLYIAN